MSMIDLNPPYSSSGSTITDGVYGGSTGAISLTNSTAASINSIGGVGSYIGGSTGAIVLVNSVLSGSINSTSGNGSYGSCYNAGSIGLISLTASRASSITALDGNACSAGDPLSITLVDSNIVSILSKGGYDSGIPRTAGLISLTNSNVTSISSTGSMGNGAAGNGDEINLVDSSVGIVSSIGGLAIGATGGNGGEINLENINNISRVDSNGGFGAVIGGNGGTVSFTLNSTPYCPTPKPIVNVSAGLGGILPGSVGTIDPSDCHSN